MTTPERRLALSLDDPQDIGQEIALKTLAALPVEDRRRVTLHGPGRVLEQAAAFCGLQPLFSELAHIEAGSLLEDARFGEANAAAGASAIASASSAIEACRAGLADAVVAWPHHETAVHATLHEGVRTALDRLTRELVHRATMAGLRACPLLGESNPSVGLFGVNPHASDGGLFGTDDERITVPAAAALREAGVAIDGPAGADMLLSQRRHGLYVAMLHDQGHIPIELLAPNASSALSIGTDVLLSSVGHGSAMDIAGRRVGDPTALLRTINLLSGIEQASAP